MKTIEFFVFFWVLAGILGMLGGIGDTMAQRHGNATAELTDWRTIGAACHASLPTDGPAISYHCR